MQKAKSSDCSASSSAMNEMSVSCSQQVRSSDCSALSLAREEKSVICVHQARSSDCSVLSPAMGEMSETCSQPHKLSDFSPPSSASKVMSRRGRSIPSLLTLNSNLPVSILNASAPSESLVRILDSLTISDGIASIGKSPRSNQSCRLSAAASIRRSASAYACSGVMSSGSIQSFSSCICVPSRCRSARGVVPHAVRV